jgi:geranylgeranyl pyrophosphate synthase
MVHLSQMAKTTRISDKPSAGQALKAIAAELERALAGWLDDSAVPEPLRAAMRYACLDGGKRLRPALVVLSAQAVGPRRQWLAEPLVPAAAVEMVHCYSLVHDDLPAMDNDTLRRGRPTVHVKFGQAMAILAGDALLTRAMEVLTLGVGEPAVACRLVGELAQAVGPTGMIAGQVADMALAAVPAGEEGVRYIHLRKTARLIRAACRMGGLCAAANEEQLSALTDFGQRLGLAFQITDDILDATHSADQLGKTPGKDAQAGKRTYAELGIEQARQHGREITAQALAALDCLGRRAQPLWELAQWLVGRET